VKKKIFFFNNGDDYLLRELNTINFFSKIKKDYICNFFFKKKIKHKLKNKKMFFIKKKFRLILWTIIVTLVNDLSIKKSTPQHLHKILDKFCFHVRSKKLLFLINIIKKTNAQKLIIFLVCVFLKRTNEFNYTLNKETILLIYDGVLSLETFDIINAANRYGNKSILIIPNWDHAFKCFLMKPTLFLAWGERSRKFIKNNFNLNCKEIGTARFELAFNVIKKIKKKKKIHKKYYKILFAGSIIPQDDMSLIRKLNNHINKKKYNVKIIYRPHPIGFSQINFDLFMKNKKKFKINSCYFDKNLLFNSGNDLKSYVTLFSNIDGLISSFSTLTLEAGIYKLPSLCYAINNPNSNYYNLFNHEIQCKYLIHLSLLNKYSNWPLKAFGADFFLNKFDELVLQITSANHENVHQVIDKIVKKEIFFDNSDYYQRLKKQIENI